MSADITNGYVVLVLFARLGISLNELNEPITNDNSESAIVYGSVVIVYTVHVNVFE